MGEGKYKKCFQDLSECQLFLEFPFNIFLFTFSSSWKQYSFLPFHFLKFDENSFYYLLFDTFPFFFFLLWILFQTTTLKQTNQIPSWNTVDKGFKKEMLIKRLNGVTSDNVSRKKKKNTYMAQSRQKWPNLISQKSV